MGPGGASLPPAALRAVLQSGGAAYALPEHRGGLLLFARRGFRASRTGWPCAPSGAALCLVPATPGGIGAAQFRAGYKKIPPLNPFWPGPFCVSHSVK